MRERDIEKYFRLETEKRGFLCMKFLSTIRGLPDRILFGGGKCWLVELKAPLGQTSAIQKHCHGAFKRRGFDVTVIRSREEVDRFVADELGGDAQ